MHKVISLVLVLSLLSASQLMACKSISSNIAHFVNTDSARLASEHAPIVDKSKKADIKLNSAGFSFIQKSESMIAGIDYIPSEIIVGFNKEASLGNVVFRRDTQDNESGIEPENTTDNVLLKNDNVVAFSRYLAEEFNMEVIPGNEAFVNDLNFCTYRLKNGVDAERVAAVLRLVYPDQIRYVQYNQIFFPCFSPNDPKWTDNTLWGIEQIGSATAWDTTKGNGARIAVIDSGIRTNSPQHEDLTWVSLPGVNVDVVDNDEIPNDVNGHGTHVCGTAAAIGNNNKGVVGVAYEAELLPIKVIGPDGYATSGSVAAGIALASTNGANVINLSLGSYSVDRPSFEAVRDAWDAGVVVVAAAGNDNTKQAHYPSAYPFVISVGASARNGSKAGYSNYGPTLDIASPGGQNQNQIYSTTRNSFNSYGDMQGTSMASPHVAGGSALLYASNPLLTPLEIRSLIETTGEDVFSQSSWQSVTKILRMNVGNAISGTLGTYPTVMITSHAEGQEITEDIVLSASTTTSGTVKGVLWYMDGEYLGTSDTAPFSLTVEVAGLIPGNHLFTAEVIDDLNLRNFDEVSLNLILEPTATPYWTTIEEPPGTDGWISFNYSGAGAWQEVGVGDVELYFGDPNKVGGAGYYTDDIDALFTPNFDLRTLTSPYFAFESAWDIGSNVYMFIRVVDSNGSDDVLGAISGKNAVWPEKSVYSLNLEKYAGTIARIEFWVWPYTGAQEGSGVYLDNILVTQSSSAPSVEILSPSKNSFASGVVNIDTNIVDDLGTIRLAELYSDDILIEAKTDPPYDFDLDTSLLSNGYHSVSVKAYDEMGYFGYSSSGNATTALIVHNSQPEILVITPLIGTENTPVVFSGVGFGSYYSGGGGVTGPVYNYSHLFFVGETGPVEAAVSVETWNESEITTIVPQGAVTGPITIQVGTFSFTTPNDFVVGSIQDFRFLSPQPKHLVENITQFEMSPQPFATSVSIKCLEYPSVNLTDESPEEIAFSLSPFQFARNGRYTLEATAKSYMGDSTINIVFFVDKLKGDFDSNTYVEPKDLLFLKDYLYLTPEDDDWLAYLDWNRNSIIEESDASAVGYNFLNHN